MLSPWLDVGRRYLGRKYVRIYACPWLDLMGNTVALWDCLFNLCKVWLMATFRKPRERHGQRDHQPGQLNESLLQIWLKAVVMVLFSNSGLTPEGSTEFWQFMRPPSRTDLKRRKDRSTVGWPWTWRSLGPFIHRSSQRGHLLSVLLTSTPLSPTFKCRAQCCIYIESELATLPVHIFIKAYTF